MVISGQEFQRSWRRHAGAAAPRAALVAVAVLATALSASAQSLPPDTEACQISGYAISRDKAGTAVRAEPDAKAKIVGRLAPPQKVTKADMEDVPPADEVWRTEFQVIGFREGWFLIEKALHPYDDPDRRGTLGKRSTGGVKTYTGRGWIALKDVGGKYTYYHRTMPSGALYAEPREEATRLPAKNAMEYPIQGGNSPKTILACKGPWVKVQSHDDVVGWWKGLCGQPIADCWQN